MAPHWLAITTADAATHLTGKRRDPVALAIAGATAVGLGYLIHQARRDQLTAEAALSEALGADYEEQLDALPTPAELRTPWRSLVNPFRTFRKPPVPIRVERNIAFGEAGRRNYLDIYRPAEPSRERPRAAAGARRRLDPRQEGGAGHPADAAPGRQGLGLRGDQLPALAAGPVAGPGHRREEGDPLDPREHRGVRRRPRLHRDHRRLRRRPPHRAHRADAQHARVAARLRGRRHLGRSWRSRTTASTTSPARPARSPRPRCATCSLPTGS